MPEYGRYYCTYCNARTARTNRGYVCPVHGALSEMEREFKSPGGQ